ncbi:DUF4763 domain-containing protein [Enterocloster bolteae]|uniref:DUF4763 domain-containing protein n=2 Tax=Lachnospiraceae TaxID=186803 RepID=UPI001FAE6238|nr:DUF4763 domain-containing protein [Enterocloster bolteae]
MENAFMLSSHFTGTCNDRRCSVGDAVQEMQCRRCSAGDAVREIRCGRCSAGDTVQKMGKGMLPGGNSSGKSFPRPI